MTLKHLSAVLVSVCIMHSFSACFMPSPDSLETMQKIQQMEMENNQTQEQQAQQQALDQQALDQQAQQQALNQQALNQQAQQHALNQQAQQQAYDRHLLNEQARQQALNQQTLNHLAMQQAQQPSAVIPSYAIPPAAPDNYIQGQTASLCMPPPSFQTLLNSVSGSYNDQGKIATVETALVSNMISSAQLKMLMQQISSDAGRMQLAEKGCARLCDPQNMYIITELFRSSRGKEAFGRTCANAFQNAQHSEPPFLNPNGGYVPPSGGSQQHDVRPVPNPVPAGPACMPESSYEHLKHQVKNAPSDTQKVSIINYALSTDYVTSRQLKNLMLHLTYDDNRLIIAKYGCHRVCDPRNIAIVAEAGATKQSRKDIQAICSGRGGRVDVPDRPIDSSQSPYPDDSPIIDSSGRLCQPMPRTDFEQLVKIVSRKTKDANKKKAIAAEIKNRMLTAWQLKTLLELIDDDDIRTIAAQTSCRQICDTDRLDIVYGTIKKRHNRDSVMQACGYYGGTNTPGGSVIPPAAQPDAGTSRQCSSMTDDEFDQLVKVAARKTKDANRKKVIDDQLKIHTISAQQLKTLLGLFNDDDSRTIAAQTSCRRICDKENIGIIYSAINKNSNRSSVMQACGYYAPGNSGASAAAGPSCRTMSNDNFTRYLDTLRRAASDKERVRLIQITANYNNFTADQAAQTFKQVYNSSLHPDIARSACPRICDRNSIRIVENAVRFSSKKNELMNICSAPGQYTQYTENTIDGRACTPMPDYMISNLIEMMRSAVNNRNLLSHIELAASRGTFSAEQVRTILKAIYNGDTRTEALKITCSRICDRNNIFLIYDAAPGTAEREKMMNLCR